MTGAELETVRGWLSAAESVLVLTGAGISAESGVPTFRGEQGLWKSHRAEELATPGAFRRDPRLVWEWYAWRRELISACEPNQGHLALARWMERSGPRVRLATQNVDGLHALARDRVGGATPAPLLELHGSIFRARCTRCGHEDPHRDAVDATSPDTLPRCPKCAALLRPAVVWFGEALPESVLEEAFRVAAASELALVVGTSSLVHPAASLPLATLEAGGRVVEVNLEPTPLTPRAHAFVHGPAGEVLPALLP